MAGVLNDLGLVDDEEKPQPRGVAPDAPQAPPVYQQPEMVIHQEGGQSTTKRTQMAPERLADIRTQEVTNNIAAEAKSREGDASVEKAGVTANQAEAERLEAERHQAELLKAREARNKEIDDKKAEYASRRSQLEKDSKITTLWEDKGKPAEILGVFMSSLSDNSHRMAGGQGPSPVQQQLDTAFAQDKEKKLRKFENSKYFTDLAKDDIGAAEKAKAAKEAEIKDQHMVMMDGIAKRFKSYAAKIGVPEAQATADRELAEMQSKNAKTLADQHKDADVETSYTSGKTSTTTNINKPDPNAGLKAPSSEDIAKRTSAIQTEKSMDAIDKITAEKPDAVKAYQDFEREWIQRETNKKIPIAGPLGDALMKGFGAAKTKDDLLRDAPPEVRRINELIENLAQARAHRGGGVVTEGDRQAAKEQLGLLGKSPSEIGKSAREYKAQSAQERKSLEAHRAFRDDEEGNARQVAPAPGATKDAALVKLVNATRSGDRDAVEAAAKAAKEAGVSADMVDGLVKNSVRKKRA